MSKPQLFRLSETGRAQVSFILDGQRVVALEGDTILTAVLTHCGGLRCDEFTGRPRAGFCLMGACQDCWIRNAEGASVRACSTFITEGMALSTGRAVG